MNNNKICRVCFKKNSTLYNLFQLIVADAEGNQVPLHEMLSYCCSVKLLPHLSQLICPLCSDACTNAYNFIKLFRKHNEVLNRLQIKPIQKLDNIPLQFEEIKIEVINEEGEISEPNLANFENTEVDTLQIEPTLIDAAEDTRFFEDNQDDSCDKYINPGGKEHQCPVCLKHFKTYESWSWHIRCHAEERFICHLCKKKYENPEEFDKHYYQDHYNFCEICQEKFTQHREYNNHMLEAHKKKESADNLPRSVNEAAIVNQESIVNEVIESNEDDEIENEEKVDESDDKQHQCPICSKVFKFYSSWSKHIKLHPGKKFNCPICSRKYENAEEFDKHYFQDHYNYCEFCKISFSIRKQFDYHRATLHKDWVKTRKFLHRRQEAESAPRRPEKRLTEHKCPTCKESFTLTEQFLNHMKKVHVDEIIICDLCDESFSSPGDYIFHYDRQHFNYCSICETGFHSRHSYNGHLRKHNERPCYATTKPHQCPYCIFRNGTFEDFVAHVKKSHEGATRCTICDEPFDNVAEYVDHYLKEHRIRCPTCNIYCTTQKLMEAHVNKNFKGKASGSKRLVRNTSAKNEKLKKKASSHICPICRQGISRFRMFRKHIWDHTDTECEKSMQCPVCNITCINAIGFYTHYKLEHYILCHKCSLYFSSKSSFESHLCEPKEETVKAKYNICPICGKTYKGTLKYHEETHQTEPNYKCEICGEKFIGYDQFRYHRKKQHGLMKHLCTYCGRLFISKTSLNEHLSIHTKYKRYSCEKCGQLFTRSGSRKKHLTKGLCGKRKIYKNPEGEVDIKV